VSISAANQILGVASQTYCALQNRPDHSVCISKAVITQQKDIMHVTEVASCYKHFFRSAVSTYGVHVLWEVTGNWFALETD
jgi:hypothetical protein